MGPRKDGPLRRGGAESFPIANCPSLADHGNPIGTSGLHNPYVFVPNDAPNYIDEAGPYWQMARQYVLADHYFPTDFGPSFTAHQYLVAGTTDIARDLAIVDYPGVLNRDGGMDLASATSWSCDSPQVLRTATLDARRVISQATGPFPCFTQYRTIADSLDARGVSWQYFTQTTNNFPPGDYIWSPFSAIRSIRFGPDWANVISPAPEVLNAAKKGRLKAVTWVVPDGRYSDHAGPFITDEGPSWVSAVVNAVGTGKQWSSFEDAVRTREHFEVRRDGIQSTAHRRQLPRIAGKRIRLHGLPRKHSGRLRLPANASRVHPD